jgi:hypothetical protein
MDDQSQTAQFKEQCLNHLDGVLRKIQGFGDGVYALDDEQLATLNIRKAEPFDIEERNVDFGPRFFYPRFTLDQARQKTTDYFLDHEEEREDCVWPNRCRRGSFDGEDFWLETPSTAPPDPEARHPLCDAMSEAGRRLKWFLGALGEDAPDPWRPSPSLGVWEGSEWHFWP